MSTNSPDIQTQPIPLLPVITTSPVSPTNVSAYTLDSFIPSNRAIAIVSITSIVGGAIGYYLYYKK